MFGCDSNFSEIKDLTLSIVTEHDAITFTLVLLKGCEHPSLSYHMICVSTIKHLTCTTGGVSLFLPFFVMRHVCFDSMRKSDLLNEALPLMTMVAKSSLFNLELSSLEFHSCPT
jgi:hypothetical protein